MASPVSRTIPPVLSLLPTLGEGREGRWQKVLEIVQKNIEPIYGSQQTLLDNVKARKELRCRLLCANNDSKGVVIYSTEPHKEKDWEGYLPVHALSAEAHHGYLIDEVCKEAVAAKAHTVYMRVSQRDQGTLHALRNGGFQVCADPHSPLLFCSKSLLPSKKRGRDEEEVVEEPKRMRQEISQQLVTCTLKRNYLQMIQQGTKTVEGRVNKGMFSRLREEQLIKFFCGQDSVVCRITKIKPYKSFKEMLEKEGVKPCLPDMSSLERATLLYNTIPGYAQDARTFGVLAIHLKVVG